MFYTNSSLVRANFTLIFVWTCFTLILACSVHVSHCCYLGRNMFFTDSSLFCTCFPLILVLNWTAHLALCSGTWQWCWEFSLPEIMVKDALIWFWHVYITWSLTLFHACHIFVWNVRLMNWKGFCNYKKNNDDECIQKGLERMTISFQF